MKNKYDFKIGDRVTLSKQCILDNGLFELTNKKATIVDISYDLNNLIVHLIFYESFDCLKAYKPLTKTNEKTYGTININRIKKANSNNIKKLIKRYTNK